MRAGQVTLKLPRVTRVTLLADREIHGGCVRGKKSGEELRQATQKFLCVNFIL